MSEATTPETDWRSETIQREEKRHLDKIQDLAERAGQYVEWLRDAALHEDILRGEDYARSIRDDMGILLDRITQIRVIRETRAIYEAE